MGQERTPHADIHLRDEIEEAVLELERQEPGEDAIGHERLPERAQVRLGDDADEDDPLQQRRRLRQALAEGDDEGTCADAHQSDGPPHATARRRSRRYNWYVPLSLASRSYTLRPSVMRCSK